MNIDLFDSLMAEVKDCGSFAKETQKNIRRDFKSDNSVVTATDIAIAERLIAKIQSLFPDCNIINEEIQGAAFDERAPYTFIFDPIDGTDSYSQGLPSWCIGVGILDREREAAGSIVYAPRFGNSCDELFMWTAPESDTVYLNGTEFSIDPDIMRQKDMPKQITTGSDLLTQIDMQPIIRQLKESSVDFKFRAFGSSLIHIVSALVFCGIDACIDPSCYVWDIAPAHALVKKCGLDYQYCTGQEFRYDDSLLLQRKKFPEPLIVGTKKGRDFLISRIRG
ncbi:inositol monophosphatase family protein [Treponema sp. HNW]|uniref:inositol monophosphatase family protein n=1 Tax=Treponema sp. HNW TaxID=3116654 RepID=UPI003D10BC8E